MDNNKESNIYRTPDDRNENLSQDRYEFSDADNYPDEQAELEDNYRSIRNNPYVKDHQTSLKKKRFWLFVLFSILSAALFVYIIYLLISIFVNMAV